MRTAAKQRELLKANAQGITGRPAVTDLLFKISPYIDNSGRGVLLMDAGHTLNDPYYHSRAEREQAERAQNGGLTDAEMRRARFYCAANEEMVLASLAPVRIVVPAGHQAREVRRGTDGKAYTAVYELDDNGKPKGIAYYDDGFSCVRPDAAVLGSSVIVPPSEGSMTPSLDLVIYHGHNIGGLNDMMTDAVSKPPSGFNSSAPTLIGTSIAPTSAFGGMGLGAKPVTFSPNTPSANGPRFELRA